MNMIDILSPHPSTLLSNVESGGITTITSEQYSVLLLLVDGNHALTLHPLAATAQKFPARPLRIICPSPPGGSVDILARTVGQYLAATLGVPVIVDNRVGASAVIGTELLAKSPPDGYTMMMGYSAHATNPIFIKKLPYDTLKDFSGVTARRRHSAAAGGAPVGGRAFRARTDRARQGASRSIAVCGGRHGRRSVDGGAPAEPVWRASTSCRSRIKAMRRRRSIYSAVRSR